MQPTRFRSLIAEIMQCQTLAVVGASRDPAKYGNMVFKALAKTGASVCPVNPRIDELDGVPAYPSLDSLPITPDCVVTVAPPSVTEQVVLDAARIGCRLMWMQPGSESGAAVNLAHAHGIQVVHGGPCIMVAATTHRRKEA